MKKCVVNMSNYSKKLKSVEKRLQQLTAERDAVIASELNYKNISTKIQSIATEELKKYGCSFSKVDVKQDLDNYNLLVAPKNCYNFFNEARIILTLNHLSNKEIIKKLSVYKPFVETVENDLSEDELLEDKDKVYTPEEIKVVIKRKVLEKVLDFYEDCMPEDLKVSDNGRFCYKRLPELQICKKIKSQIKEIIWCEFIDFTGKMELSVRFRH